MRKCILSINGNRAMSFLLQTIVGEKFDLIAVGNVFHGMSVIRKNRNIETIIVDLDFEPEEAWALINHIKTSKLYDLQVYVLSSVNNQKIQQNCLHYGIEEIFLKPFNPLEILRALNNSIYQTV